MKDQAVFRRIRSARFAAFAMLACVMAWFALTAGASPAHALFTSDAHLETVHTVKAFPTGIVVDAEGYKARSQTVDRDQLTVTASFSDGTTRVLDGDEYELSYEDLPAGYKGTYGTDLTYREEGHEVSVPFAVYVDEAYGAQYGDTLVFGRGIPEDTYEGKALTNTTWGIEDGNIVNRWNANTLVNVVDIDTVSLYNASWLFANSPKLRTVALDQMDMSRVTTMWAMFATCPVLTTVSGVETWDTSNVTTFEGMFHSDFALASVNVSKLNTSKARTFRSMFISCGSLTSVDCTNWKTPCLTEVHSMFSMVDAPSTPRLSSVGNLAGWDMSHVKEMSYMFYHCSSISNIGDISHWNTSSATGMIAMFRNCPLLRNVNCSSWTTTNVTQRWDFNTDSPGVTQPRWS